MLIIKVMWRDRLLDEMLIIKVMWQAAWWDANY